MPHLSTEDTMIGAQPPSPLNLLLSEPGENAEPTGMLERCRAMFRSFGERVSSFDLSRQIYG